VLKSETYKRRVSEKALEIYLMCMYLPIHVINRIVFGVFEHSNLRLVK
jgi:hypothetical protein